MADTLEPEVGLFVRDDDEGLFSRDINGQLVRLDAPTESDEYEALEPAFGSMYGSRQVMFFQHSGPGTAERYGR